MKRDECTDMKNKTKSVVRHTAIVVIARIENGGIALRLTLINIYVMKFVLGF